MKRKSAYKEICKLTFAAAAIGAFSAPATEAVEIKDVLDSYVEATVLPTYSQMSDSAIEFNKASRRPPRLGARFALLGSAAKPFCSGLLPLRAWIRISTLGRWTSRSWTAS